MEAVRVIVQALHMKQPITDDQVDQLEDHLSQINSNVFHSPSVGLLVNYLNRNRHLSLDYTDVTLSVLVSNALYTIEDALDELDE
jgi:hypothetical protein